MAARRQSPRAILMACANKAHCRMAPVRLTILKIFLHSIYPIFDRARLQWSIEMDRNALKRVWRTEATGSRVQIRHGRTRLIATVTDSPGRDVTRRSRIRFASIRCCRSKNRFHSPSLPPPRARYKNAPRARAKGPQKSDAIQHKSRGAGRMYAEETRFAFRPHRDRTRSYPFSFNKVNARRRLVWKPLGKASCCSRERPRRDARAKRERSICYSAYTGPIVTLESPTMHIYIYRLTRKNIKEVLQHIQTN